MNYKINEYYILLFVGVTAFLFFFFIKKKEKFTSRNPIIEQIKINFSKLHPSLYKIPIYEGKKPETENKSKITMCIKNPDTGRYYDMNSIMYVALHELSHVLSKNSKDHDEIFDRNFALLRQKAYNVGIYDPNIPMPIVYCGIGPE